MTIYKYILHFTYSKTNYFHFKTLHYICFPNQFCKTTNTDSLMSVCLCIVCAFMHATACVWKSENNPKEWFSPSTKWVSGIEYWSIRLGDSDIALSHLPSHISPLTEESRGITWIRRQRWHFQGYALLFALILHGVAIIRIHPPWLYTCHSSIRFSLGHRLQDDG